MTAHAVANWFGDSPLVFSSNSDVLFSCAECRILCFAIPSGEYLCDLVGHTRILTGIVLSPANEEHLVSCAKDKTIKVWNYMEGVCIKTIQLDGLPLGLAAGTVKKAKKEGKRLVYTYIYVKKNDGEYKVAEYNLLAVDLKSDKITTKYKIPTLNFIVADSSGQYVAISENFYVTVSESSSNKIYRVRRRHYINRIAFHPTKKTLAMADSTGNITLWKDFHKHNNKRSGRGKDIMTGNTCHWHSHEIGALRFTQDGGYLISVGEESVMVTWQLETLNRQFLPRIGGHLSHLAISPNDKWIAIGDRWNAIRLVDPITNSVTRSITGMYSLRPAHEWRLRHIPDPASPGTILCSAQPGSLQCFDLLHMRSVGAIEVAPRNIISRTAEKALQHEDVWMAALRADGQEMATISVFKTNSLLGATQGKLLSHNLRFWKRSSDGRLWHLLTDVKRPHRGRITCLRMCALHSLALTCGDDGTFKIWTAYETKLAPTPKALLKRQNVLPNAQSKVMWKCSGVGTFGAEEFVSGDISSDGACLAVATKNSISLWEIAPSLKRRRIIDLGEAGCPQSVRFLPKHPLLLLLRMKNHVVLFDLDRTGNVDLKVMWTFPPQSTPQSVKKDERSKEQKNSPAKTKEKQIQMKIHKIVDVTIHPLLPRVLIATKREKLARSTQLEVMGPEGPLRKTIEVDLNIVKKSLSFVELPEDGTVAQAGRLSAVFTSRSIDKRQRGILHIIKDLLAGATPIVAEEAATKEEATGVKESLKELKKKKRKKKKRKLDVHGEKSKKTKRL